MFLLKHTISYIILSTIGGDDYISLVEVLTFNIGEFLQEFSVDIIDDNIDENNESFRVFLKTTDDDPNVLIVGFNPTDVTIIDDD